MKLLIIFFGNDYHGGTSYSTFTIAKELMRRGHDVHAYVNVTPVGSLACDLRECGVTVHHGRAPIITHPLHERRPIYKVARFVMEQVRRYYAGPRSERAVEGIIRSYGIDLIVISSGAIVTGARASHNTGTPLVWHIREFMKEDHGLDYYPWAHAHEYMKEASCLVCVSRAIESKMQHICPDVRTEVVYNGIDQDIFHPNGREVRPDGAPVRLMFSGGIKRSKGTFLVVDALAQLGSDISFTLDIFGDEGGGVGESAKELRSHCRNLGLLDVVCYHGLVTNIADEYRRHDIQIVASRCEAFGRVTAEAMLCGCAVVGSNSGGTPELISDGRGYLFESNDTESLARALTKAVSNSSERTACVERALSYACENFSVNTYVDAVETIYRSVST